MESVGVGIIGAGYWGRKLTREYLDAERRGRVKLIKVCDSSLASLSALMISKETDSISQERLTQNIDDVLKNPEITAVHIATPNVTHFQIAKRALEAGKHVLVEKPMTLSSRECFELLDLATQKKLVIEVGHLFRFNRALQVAAEMLQENKIGNVFYVRLQWTDQNIFPDRDIIFDLGPHPIDILNMLLRKWPKDVSGVARAYRNSKTHNEIAYIFAEYPDGILAHIELSWLHPSKVREVSIVGSRGTLVVDCTKQSIHLHSPDKITEINVTPSNTLAAEIDHFVDKVLTCDLTVDVTGPLTVETLEMVRASLWNKIPVIAQLKSVEDKSTESRSRHLPNLETAASLLEAVRQLKDLTPIINHATFSSELVQEYLAKLEKLDLIKSGGLPGEESYSITAKGQQILADFYSSQSQGNVNKRQALEEALGIQTD